MEKRVLHNIYKVIHKLGSLYIKCVNINMQTILIYIIND